MGNSAATRSVAPLARKGTITRMGRSGPVGLYLRGRRQHQQAYQTPHHGPRKVDAYRHSRKLKSGHH